MTLNLPWTVFPTSTGAVVLDVDNAAVCYVDRTMIEVVKEAMKIVNEKGEEK
jgi:hypothetical protein